MATRHVNRWLTLPSPCFDPVIFFTSATTGGLVRRQRLDPQLPGGAGPRGKRSGLGSETAAGPRPTRRRSTFRASDAASIACHGAPQVRLHHRRRRLGRERAGQPVIGRSGHPRPGHRSRASRLSIRRLHPHAGGADLPDRQPLLRLDVRVGTRAVHERPAHLPRARQGPRRLIEHQRPDLPARQPARLRALGGRSRDGDLGLRALPAVLQEDGGLPGGRPRRSVAWP